MRVVLADDESYMRLLLKKAMNRYNETHGNCLTLLGECENGAQAVLLVEKYRPDCVFLDVEMPETDGVLAAKQILDIAPKTMLVFITAHQEYMPQAFSLYAFDYMIKPFQIQRFFETLDRMVELTKPKIQQEEKIYFKTKEGGIFFEPHAIVLVQRENRQTVIVSIEGKFVVSQTLSELEELLPKNIFVRSHKSYLINIQKIKKLQPYGRWTHVVSFDGIQEDALMTHEKAKELGF